MRGGESQEDDEETNQEEGHLETNKSLVGKARRGGVHGGHRSSLAVKSKEDC